jgi:hypothetical protein
MWEIIIMKVNRKRKRYKGSNYEVVRLENEVIISNIVFGMFHKQPYNQNGCVEVTYKTFCKEPHIN